MIISQDELASVRAKHAAEKIVLTSGTFDLLHVGHIHFLEWVREHGDILVVMLSGDDRVKYRKGNGRPIIPEAQRAEILDALKLIDYVFIDPNHNEPGSGHPSYAKIMTDLQPDAYAADGIEERFAGLEGNTAMFVSERQQFAGHEISTSAIIDRIRSIS